MVLAIPRYIFIFILIIISIPFSQAETHTTLNLYINSQTTSQNPDGTSNNPYPKLSEAFSAFLQATHPILQVNFYIAPNSESYTLEKEYAFNFDGVTSTNITITSWFDETFGRETNNNSKKAIVDFGTSRFYFENVVLLAFINLEVICHNGTINAYKSNVLLKNVIFRDQLALHDKSFINLTDCDRIWITNVNILVVDYVTLVVVNEKKNVPGGVILLENITIVTTPFSQPKNGSYESYGYIFAFRGIITDKTFIIKNFQLKSTNSEIAHFRYLGCLFYVDGFNDVSISNFTVENQRFFQVERSPSIVIKAAKYLNINGLKFAGNDIIGLSDVPMIFFKTIEEVHFSNTEFSSNNLISESNPVSFSFCRMTLIDKILFNNTHILHNEFQKSSNLFEILDYSLADTKAFAIDLKITNLIISQNTNQINQTSLVLFVIKGSSLQSFQVDGVSFIQNEISGSVFSLQTRSISQSVEVGKPSPPQSIFFSKITIKDNFNAIDTNFLYFFPIEDVLNVFDCLQLVEYYIIWIKDLEVTNNTFKKGLSKMWVYEVHFFQIKETQVHIENSIIANNNFEHVNFLTLDERPSTIIFINNQVINNAFSSSSLLVSEYLTLDNACSAIGNTLTAPPVLKHRYSFILESKFSGNSFINSTLFELDNGFFVIHKNLFINLIFRGSHMIKSEFSPVILPPNAQVYTENELLKTLTLGTYSPSWTIYNETVELALSYDLGEMCFYSMHGNIFSDIFANNSELISLKGFGNKESLIRVENNKFVNMNFPDDLTILFTIDSAESMLIQSNLFKNIQGKATMFNLLQCKKTKLLQINSNLILKSTMSQFLAYAGDKLNHVNVRNNFIQKTKYSYSFLTLYAIETGTTWEFSNNIMLEVALRPSTAFEQERFSLFTIIVKNKESSPHIYVTKSLFDGINFEHVSKEGGALKSSLFEFETSQPITMVDVIIQNSDSKLLGSFLHFSSAAPLTINNTIFSSINFTSSNGLIFSASNETLVYESSFFYITNRERSEVITLSSFDSRYSVRILNSRFKNLTTKSSPLPMGVIFNIKSLAQTQLSFEFSNNTVIDIINSNVLYFEQINCDICLIKDSVFTFEDEELEYSRDIILLEKETAGKLFIKNITLPFQDFKNKQYSFLYIQNSDIEVVMSDIKHVNNNTLSLATLDSGSLTIENSLFKEISLKDKSLIEVRLLKDTQKIAAPKLSLKNCSFLQNRKYEEVTSDEGSLEQALNSYYYENQASFTLSIVQIPSPISLSVQNCTFENMFNIPAIFMERIISDQTRNYDAESSILVEDSIFRNITYLVGPAITIVPNRFFPRVNIKNCIFESNSAIIGGALVIHNSALTISDSFFINNSATHVGSAIFSDLDPEEIQKNVSNTLFKDNKALYQGDFGTEAQDFILFYEADDPVSNGIKSKATLINGWSLTLSNVSSMNLRDGVFVLYFLDLYGNIAPIITTYIEAKFEVPRITSNGQITYDKFITSFVRKEHDHLTINVSLKEIMLLGEANETIQLNLSLSSYLFNRAQVISINIRPCLPGEYNDSNICQPCIDQTYSLEPTQPCTACPLNAECSSSHIFPKPGYWNNDTSSAIIFECRNDDVLRCNNTKEERKCSTGYTGPLCNACDFEKGFIETGYLKCGLCEDKTKSLVYSIIGSILYVLYQIFCINAIYEGKSKESFTGTNYLRRRKIEKSYYIKSLLTYTQLMSILYLANPKIYKGLGTTSQIGNPVALIVYGTQCTMKAFGIDHNMFLFYQTLLAVSTPLIQLTIISFLILLVKFFQPKIHVKKIIVVAVIYFIISYQPGVATNLALFLSCTKKERLGYDYVASHPYWRCDDPLYKTYSTYIAKPNLVIWCMLIPLTIFIILAVNRHKLKTGTMRTSLGVLFTDLKGKYYYWGVVLMMLKIMLSLLAYGLEQEGEVLIFVSLLLLWLYQGLVGALQPYQTSSFNNFEKTLINLLMFNIIASRYLLDTANENLVSKVALIASIVFNGGFVLLLTWKILSLTLLNVLAFVEKDIFQRRITRRVDFSEDSYEPRDKIKEEENAML